MRRFGVLLASAALGAAVAASGPALAFGGGHGGGFRRRPHGRWFWRRFHGGGFGGGHFGGFGGRSMATGGFNRGFGFNRSFAAPRLRKSSAPAFVIRSHRTLFLF